MRRETLSLKDVLREPIEVQGLWLDADVDAELYRIGHGEAEIASLSIRNLGLYLPRYFDGTKTDRLQFSGSDPALAGAFESAVTEYIMRLSEAEEWDLYD
jgi:hypothetical protein